MLTDTDRGSLFVTAVTQYKGWGKSVLALRPLSLTHRAPFALTHVMQSRHCFTQRALGHAKLVGNFLKCSIRARFFVALIVGKRTDNSLSEPFRCYRPVSRTFDQQAFAPEQLLQAEKAYGIERNRLGTQGLCLGDDGSERLQIPRIRPAHDGPGQGPLRLHAQTLDVEDNLELPKLVAIDPDTRAPRRLRRRPHVVTRSIQSAQRCKAARISGSYLAR